MLLLYMNFHFQQFGYTGLMIIMQFFSKLLIQHVCVILTHQVLNFLFYHSILVFLRLDTG